jgi:hypothetical protein
MSPKYSLNVNDVVNLTKNAVLVGTGAVLTYVIENINTVDWGNTGVLLVPVVTLLLDAVVKWLKGPKVVEVK